MLEYEAVIGLEVHAQLQTSSKLFCSCPVSFGDAPNTNICEICAGFPGALPLLNKKAVELAAKAGLALHCTINEYSLFARKNYFYPDLPDGYQTTQFTPPLCENGYITLIVQGLEKRIGINRVHLENDAGKCIHAQDKTLLDLNRAGTGLIEIVSEPDMRTPEEAAAYMRAVHAILVYAGISDGNMEEGNLRCDANISIRPRTSSTLGTRTEIKNLNSFRHIQRAVEYEIQRQKMCLEENEPILQETRLFDAVKQRTVSMRSKENAHDYRYFPSPDLTPVRITAEQITAWQAELPELPEERKRRFLLTYDLNEEETSALLAEKAIADFFENAVQIYKNPKRLAHLLLSEYLRECAQNEFPLDRAPMSVTHFAEFAQVIDEGLISARIGHSIFSEVFAQDLSPKQYIQKQGLAQVSDEAALEVIIREIMQEHKDKVEELRAGKIKIRTFLIGQVMRQTKGKANPALVNDLLEKQLAQG